jgi:hypothetical protein
MHMTFRLENCWAFKRKWLRITKPVCHSIKTVGKGYLSCSDYYGVKKEMVILVEVLKQTTTVLEQGSNVFLTEALVKSLHQDSGDDLDLYMKSSGNQHSCFWLTTIHSSVQSMTCRFFSWETHEVYDCTHTHLRLERVGMGLKEKRALHIYWAAHFCCWNDINS